VTVTRSVGQEIQYLERQESEFVAMEQKDGNVQVQQGLLDRYEPQNRREPFLPLVIPPYGERRSSSIEESRAQKSTWKLLGILSGMQGYFASIQNSEGKRFIVTPGSVIPSEGLVVKQISKTELEFHYLNEGNGTTNQERSQRLIVSF
ncbi:MAG: hypothetical protein JSU59_09435, partial [Nitrospirota bacterium]